MGRLLLQSRRFAIFGVLLLAYLYYHTAGEAQLAQIGLLSFAAVAQFGPAFFGGLFWQRATARGAIAGLAIGVAVWAYTLLLPSFVAAGMLDRTILDLGLFGIQNLRPQALFGLDAAPLTHGVFWSLGLNVLAFIGVSLITSATPIERMQASVFVRSESAPMAPGFRLWRSSVTVGELIATVARYLGEERTRRSFESFAADAAPVARARQRSRHPSAALCRAHPRLGHRRRLLAARAVAAPAQGRGVAEGGAQAARRRLRRDPVQPRDPAIRPRSRAPGHRRVRQGSAADLLEPRSSARCSTCRPIWCGSASASIEILRRTAERGDFGPGPVEHLVADRIERYTTPHRELPGTPADARHRRRGALQPHARRRFRRHLYRHHARRSRRPRRSSAPTRTWSGACTSAPRNSRASIEALARAKVGGRRGQHFQDPLSRRRQPRHSAAAERGAALCDQPGRAQEHGRGRQARQQYRRVARGGRGNPRRAARHLAPRHRRDEAGNLELRASTKS